MKKEIRKLRESFLYALRGLRLCVLGERNFRVHTIAALYVTAFALLGRANFPDCASLFLCFGLTMGAELMNTAIECLCDRQATGYDGFVRDAKDIAAAGVFVCAVACVGVGLCIFIGNGVLIRAFECLKAHPWGFVAFAASVPAALWFVFKFPPVRKR